MAICALLLGHFVPGFGTDAPVWGINFGRAGVELFLALSGCLIGTVLFRHGMPLPKFAWRRFARIVPSMWVYLLAIAAGSALLGADISRRAIAIGAAGVLNLAGPGPGSGLLGHLWSVGLELQGYAVLGAVAWVCRRGRWAPHRWLFACVAIGWVVTAATRPTDYYAFWLPQHRLTAMVLGAALVSFGGTEKGRALIGRWPWWPCLVVGLALQTNATPDIVKYTLGSALLAIACARVAVLPDRLAQWLARPWLVALGTASYSIYLWQQPFHVASSAHQVAWWLALPLALVWGWAAFKYWDTALNRAALGWATTAASLRRRLVPGRPG